MQCSDLVAGLAILTAMLLNQPFAGLVIVLMQTGGEALEHYAERRATRDSGARGGRTTDCPPSPERAGRGYLG